MASGMEMMIQSAMMNMLPKLLDKLPPELSATIGQIGQTVQGFKDQADRIEHQQRLIMARLNIPLETEISQEGLHDGHGTE